MGLNMCSYLLKKGTDNFAACTKDDAKKAGEIQVGINSTSGRTPRDGGRISTKYQISIGNFCI